jgi:hypothetical protein
MNNYREIGIYLSPQEKLPERIATLAVTNSPKEAFRVIFPLERSDFIIPIRRPCPDFLL